MQVCGFVLHLYEHFERYGKTDGGFFRVKMFKCLLFFSELLNSVRYDERRQSATRSTFGFTSSTFHKVQTCC